MFKVVGKNVNIQTVFFRIFNYPSLSTGHIYK